MPELTDPPSRLTNENAFFDQIDAAITEAIKVQGFTATLKLLKKGEVPSSSMMTVVEGVVEKMPSGLYNGAFQTDQGRVVLKDAQRIDRASPDPQLISSNLSQSIDETSVRTVDEILSLLSEAGTNSPSGLICEIEFAHFDSSQKQTLLPLLWNYIVDHRNSNIQEELVAVGSAIRKYIAIMPMERMGELAVLLESGNKSPLPIDLEIEVAKMIFRNFEVHPPIAEDSHPQLAQQLLEIVLAYTNPRILLKEKHAAAASLAIEAIVSMRSSLAEQAWKAAVACPHRWFAELVSDDLDDLFERWNSNNPEAAAWLLGLRNNVVLQG